MPSSTAPAADHQALRPERLFARLSGAGGIVTAVSGGPDSTALMMLLAGWADRPPILVVSVDHGLRPESADEARLAVRNAGHLGFPSRTMCAPPRPPAGNLQDWARRVRYALLAQAAREAGFDTIVTAHHQEDQAETFLLRLARGSGVYGLGAMHEEAATEGLRLVRPLLQVPKAALADVAAASGLELSADPSNTDVRFDRVRLRKLQPALSDHGLTARRLSRTAQQLQRAAAALDHYAQACLADHFQADRFGAVSGPAEALANAPEETALRALGLLCRAVGGAEYTPQLDRLEKVLSALLQGAGVGFRRTLHGATIELVDGRITVRREWGRNGLDAIAAPGGATVVWDRRFRLEVPEQVGATHVRALGHCGRRLRLPGATAAALRTLPGLYRAGGLVAAPEEVESIDDGPAIERVAAHCLVAARLGLSSVQPIRSP